MASWPVGFGQLSYLQNCKVIRDDPKIMSKRTDSTAAARTEANDDIEAQRAQSNGEIEEANGNDSKAVKAHSENTGDTENPDDNYEDDDNDENDDEVDDDE